MTGQLTPEAIIEVVAEAVHDARWHPLDRHRAVPFSEEDASGQAYCRRLSTAAIIATLVAVREPTPGMVEEGHIQCELLDNGAVATWLAMLDHLIASIKDANHG